MTSATIQARDAVIVGYLAMAAGSNDRGLTVAALVGLTGLSSSTIWNSLARLQAAGVVVAESLGPESARLTRGRPKNLYTLKETTP